MRLDINLATRPYFDQQLIARILIAFVLMLAFSSAWSGFQVYRRTFEIKRLKASIAGAEGRLNARPAGVAEEEHKRLMASIKSFNALIDQKTYPWHILLDSIELAVPDGIALSVFAPDIKTGDVRIDGRSRGFDRIQRLIEQLEQSGRYRKVMLLSHRSVYYDERAEGYEFSLSAKMVMP